MEKNQKESDCIFANKWKNHLQSNQYERKVANRKNALEDRCKYENVSD